MAHETNRDVPLELWGSNVIIPKGTRVRLVKDASGTKGDLWAVESVSFLIKLTGNSHDPKYRYAFVPDDAVSPINAA